MLKRFLPLIIVLAIIAIFWPLVLKHSMDRFNKVYTGTWSVTNLNQNLSQNPLCKSIEYVFPKQASESIDPLPKKVEESFKSVIGITVRFSFNNWSPFFTATSLEYSGSGFRIEPGVFISARHIFMAAMIDNQIRFPFSIDKNGLPISSNYTYEFCGTANINGKPVNFPLELIGMGDPYRSQDFAAFKAIKLPIQIRPLKFAGDLVLNDKVYSGGRIPMFDPLFDLPNNNLNSVRRNLLIDFINYIFIGQISAILVEMPNNKVAGLEKVYRISGTGNNPEPGYSGGPVFNSEGNVVGMTVLVSGGLNFSHAISANDLKKFVQNLKN